MEESNKKNNISLKNLECSCLMQIHIFLSPHVSLKVATNGFLRGKEIRKVNIFKAIFINQKRWSATKNIDFFLINLTLIYFI